MAFLLKGNPVADSLCQKTKEQCRILREKGIVPVLAIVRVGERACDVSYERGAMKRAEQLGIAVRKCTLPESCSKAELIDMLRGISAAKDLHGCLLFRPLPAHLQAQDILDALCPEKDVDGMTTASMGMLLTGKKQGFAPCTPSACLALLRHYQIPLQGKKITIIGKSASVGLPTALLMMNEEATVSVCHILSDPADTKAMCRAADIIISAAGCPGLVSKEDIRPGQTVIDVGVSMGKDGKLRGDADFDEVEPVVDAITPVPGGIGAVTTAVLMAHVASAALRAYCLRS